MTDHPIDHPVWTCLTTDHAKFAIGDGPLRRYISDVSLIGAIQDTTPKSLDALRDSVLTHGPIALASPFDIPVPQGLALSWKRGAVQMTFDGETPAKVTGWNIAPLSDDDAPEMLALALLTRPGPFAKRTHELGQFWGVRENGKLIGMAGERFRQPGFAEISGICTHPDARGRGLGIALSNHVTRAVIERGETPYLHAFADNDAAIRLYQRLGYRLRIDRFFAIAMEAA